MPALATSSLGVPKPLFLILSQIIFVSMGKERIVTIMIPIGLFGGLVGGPIASLADYHAPPERRFWLFIIPEFIGFACLVLIVIYGKSRKKISNES